MQPHPLTRQIDTSFPTHMGLVVLAASIPEHAPPLHAEEEAAVARAIPKRRREFATARALAREAMTALGTAPGPILRGPERQPLWPEGVTGSLSHAGELAVAAVARAGSLRSVGIDLEVADRVGEGLYDKLFSAEEQTFIRGQPTEGADGLAPAAAASRMAGLAFSAKEAGYKATYALAGKYVAFRDAVIEIDPERRTFRFRYVGRHAPSRVMEEGEGHYLFHERYVLSLFIIR